MYAEWTELMVRCQTDGVRVADSTRLIMELEIVLRQLHFKVRFLRPSFTINFVRGEVVLAGFCN